MSIYIIMAVVRAIVVGTLVRLFHRHGQNYSCREFLHNGDAHYCGFDTFGIAGFTDRFEELICTPMCLKYTDQRTYEKLAYM